MNDLMNFEIDYNQEVSEQEALYGCDEINRELNIAWDIVENTDSNLFLTGKAGTGKTTFLKKLRETSRKNILVLAPTGIAAINASGVTIHSFFQFPLSPYIPGKGFISHDKRFLRMSQKKREILRSVSLLVVDEVSMVRPDLLDAIDNSLRKIRQSSRPFGGVQLLLIGDLRQLPPVVREEEWNLLNPYYNSQYFYESQALKKAGFRIVELTMVYRQSDKEFINILNRIRDGEIDQQGLNELNRKCLLKSPLNEEGYIRLTTHNHHCARINEDRLESLPEDTMEYNAEVEGIFPESAYPADFHLRLKKGAQVIFVKNDTGSERKFYNGLIGTVVSLSREKVRVRIPSGKVIDVVPMEWENAGFKQNEATGKIEQTVEGVFRQFPLQLAWAITIHKSQGLTFDKAIIDASNSFAPGQTYVALSRCRNLEGLRLERPLTMHSVIIDHHISNFIKENLITDSSKSKLDELKNEYFYNSFLDLFNFDSLNRTLTDLVYQSFDTDTFTIDEGTEDLYAAKDILDNEIIKIASKFTTSYSKETITNKFVTCYDHLKERIKKASQYFTEKLRRLEFYIDILPVNMDFNVAGRKLFDALKFEIQFKRKIFEVFSKEDFSSFSYENIKERIRLELHKKAIQRRDSVEKYKGVKKKASIKKSKIPTTEVTYDLFSQGKNIEEVAMARSLKANTIADHIIKLIQSGKIKKEEVIDMRIYPQIKEKIEKHKGLPYKEHLDKVNQELTYPLPSYLFKIYREV